MPTLFGIKNCIIVKHDYDKAKRAAVTCRRIEYSYNLKNMIKSELSLDEIIVIQRWWREILRKKNNKLIKELKIKEKIKKKGEHKYFFFLNKICYIYFMHFVRSYMNKLTMKYGKIYYKNKFNKHIKHLFHI